MNIVFVYSDNATEKNCSVFRCEIPAAALKRAGHETALVYVELFEFGRVDSLLQAADVIVIERNLFGSALHLQMRRWREQGKLVVADFDDAYDLMPSNLAPYQLWGRGLTNMSDGRVVPMHPHPLVQFRQGLEIANCVTTPSRRLCLDTLPYNAHPLLRENWLDWPLYESLHREPHDGIWIGWGGSMSHIDSWLRSNVLGALLRVFRERDDVRLVLNGSDSRIAAILPESVRERTITRPWVALADWPAQCAQYDLALAPLAGPYDERRSSIKVLEYLACGVPFVASKYPGYTDTPGLSSRGELVENTVEGWHHGIQSVLDNLPAQQAFAGTTGREYAKAHSADACCADLIALFEGELARIQREREQRTARVSVIVTCYNLAQYLPMAVESVAAQTFEDWEIIIVDDASTDDTQATVQALLERFPHRKIISVSRGDNVGLPAARNAGIAVASGEYILPLDADDMLLPAALETLAKTLDDAPDVGIAYSNYMRFGYLQGEVLAVPVEEYENPRRTLNGLPYCSLYRKSVWQAVGGYNEAMRGAIEDWDYWLSCLEHGVRAVHVQEPLFMYRVRADSQSVTAEAIMPEALQRMQSNHAALFGDSNETATP